MSKRCENCVHLRALNVLKQSFFQVFCAVTPVSIETEAVIRPIVPEAVDEPMPTAFHPVVGRTKKRVSLDVPSYRTLAPLVERFFAERLVETDLSDRIRSARLYEEFLKWLTQSPGQGHCHPSDFDIRAEQPSHTLFGLAISFLHGTGPLSGLRKMKSYGYVTYLGYRLNPNGSSERRCVC